MAGEKQGEAKPGAYEALTHKQRRFVDAYFELGFNATRAAEVADYKQPHSQGPRLLENVGVKTAISERMDSLAMPANEVLARLAGIARGDISQVLDVNGDPDVTVALDNKATHLIKSYTVVETTVGKDGVSRRTRVELHDPLRALELIGKHHGLFKEQAATPVEVTVNINDSRARFTHLVNRHAASEGAGGDSGGAQ